MAPITLVLLSRDEWDTKLCFHAALRMAVEWYCGMMYIRVQFYLELLCTLALGLGGHIGFSLYKLAKMTNVSKKTLYRHFVAQTLTHVNDQST